MQRTKKLKQVTAILTADCMKRTKFHKVKRKEIQGSSSVYHKIWNEHHPNDLIIPKTGFVIHHIDGNHNNNSPDNLLKMTDIEHKKYHTHDGRHPNQNKKFSEELKKKLSDSHLGQTAWNKGKTGIYSEETKYKMGAGHRGKPSACGMSGKTHSDETRKKMSGKIPWNKGKKMSIEFCIKSSKACQGRILSESHKEKISKSMKEYYEKNNKY